MTTVDRLRSRMSEMAACREAGRTMQSYLDGELDGERAARVSAHLERCLRCGLEAEAFRYVRSVLRDLSGPGPFRVEDPLAVKRLHRFATTLAAPSPGGA